MLHFVFENHDTVFLVWPLTDEAADWLHATAPEDAIFFNGALVVEHRYASDVLFAVYKAGFTWSTSFWPDKGSRGWNGGRQGPPLNWCFEGRRSVNPRIHDAPLLSAEN
jgi:hypothetical protein